MKKTIGKLMAFAAFFGVALLGGLSAQAGTPIEILVCKTSERTDNGNGTYTYTDSQNVQKTFSHYASSLADAVTQAQAAGSDCLLYVGGTGVVSGDKLNPVQFVVNADENSNVASIYLDANAEMAVGKASTCTKVDISRFHGLGFVSAYGMVEIDKSAVPDDFTGTLGVWGTITGSSSFVSSIENAAYDNLNNNGATLYVSGKAFTVGSGKTLGSGEVLKTVVDASDFTVAVESQDGGSFKNQVGNVIGTKGELAMLVAITNYSCYTSPSTSLSTWNGSITGDIDISLKDARMNRTATFVSDDSASYTYDSYVTAVVDHSQFYQTQNGGDFKKKGYLTASMWNAGSGTLTQNGNVDYVVRNTVYASGAATTMYALYSAGSGKSVVNGDINIGFFDNTADSFSIFGVNNAGSTAGMAELTGNLAIAVSGSTLGSVYGSVQGAIGGDFAVVVTNSTAKTFAVLSGDLATITGNASIAFDGTDTVSAKISGFDTVAIHEGSTLNVKHSTVVDFAETWSNAGTMTVDMTGATDCEVLLVNCTGEGTMTLQDYGSVTLTSNDGYSLAVIDNDLYATKPVVAQVISAGGATTNKYDNLPAALAAAKTPGKTCVLLKDVTLTGNWTPIADFAGTFDGQGHTISGLNIVEPDPLFDDGDGNLIEARLGLFAYLNAGIVRNLTISGATVTSTTSGARHIGVLAGSAYCGSDEGFVSNVIVTASQVSSVGKYVGGLVGNDYTDIYDCQVLNTTVTGKDQVGGVAGYMWCGSIEGCTATGNTVSATEERAGGLVGKVQFCAGNDSPMWINGNTVSGTATAPDYAGGIAAQVLGDNAGYAIKDNEIDVTLSAPGTSPIAVLRNDPDDQPDNAFTQSITKNMTGNRWTDATSAADSYTFSSDCVPASKNYTVYRGRVRIGETLYQTLAAAIAAVKDGETIDVLADNSEQIQTPPTATSFTFNSNGFDLSQGYVAADPTCKFVKVGNTCVYQKRVYGVVVVQTDGTVRGAYETMVQAIAAAAADDTVTIVQDWEEDLAVPAAKTITFDGRAADGSAFKLTGAISVEDGGSLSIIGGTFTDLPFAYLPTTRAMRTNDDGTYTVVAATVAPKQQELPEPEEVKDSSGTAFEDMTEDKQEQAAAAVAALSTNLVESVNSPTITQVDTGVGEVVKENKSAMVALLKEKATEQGLTEEAKNQIENNLEAFVNGDESSTNTSNNVLIEVDNFNAKVTSVSETTMTGTPTKVVFEVTPLLQTTVTNTVAGESEVVTVSTVIPNSIVKEMAEKGNPMTFNLPISDSEAMMASVKHISSDPTQYPDETFTCPVETNPVTGERFIVVTVTHFSQFEVTTSSAVLVDTDETIGIYKLDQLAAGATAFGVPFLKSGTTTETSATLAQLVTTGAQTGDAAKGWTAGSDDTGTFQSVAGADEVVPGKSLWYTRAAASATPLTLAGYVVTNGLKTAGAASATERPGLTLFTNPKREAIADVFAKLSGTLADGDQIVLVGGGTRYVRRDGTWREVKVGTVQQTQGNVTVRAATTDIAADALPLAVGESFWYVSRGGTPTVTW